MALTPSWFLADFQSGVLYGEVLRLENVRLTSSLEPGEFSADLDVRQFGELGTAWRVMDLLRDGKCTLVPILEGTTRGPDKPPTSTPLGEWWISDIVDSPPSPIVRISGPEFAGYYKHVLAVEDARAERINAMVAVREQLEAANSTGQNIVMDIGDARDEEAVALDIVAGSTTVWDGIEEAALASGFQWRIDTGLEMEGWSPRQVTRRLNIGKPRLRREMRDIPLEISGPGAPATAVTTFTRTTRESANATGVSGWGAGSGKDQVAASTSRERRGAEPVKTRVLADPGAMTVAQLQQRVNGALREFSPQERAFTARFHAWFHIPRVGAAYSFYSDPQWTRPAASGDVYSVGWTWRSDAPEFYDLDLVEG